MGASKGVVRRLPVNENLVYDYIPVDIVVNQLLVTGYHVSTIKYVQSKSIKKSFLKKFFNLQIKGANNIPLYIKHI